LRTKKSTGCRAYAQALLNTHVGAAFLPLGCTWTSPSAKRLAERIGALGRPSMGPRRVMAGAGAVAILGAALSYAAWAQQPEPQVIKVAGWNAPAGLLSPIQAFPGTNNS
jgi:beta-lactamase regulating signal transducer with metallopeptidase domain